MSIVDAPEGMTREEALARAKENVAGLHSAIREMKERAERDDPGVARETAPLIGQLQKTLTLLLETENKIDDLERRVCGASEPIDLGAARDEVGRRLDRLRAVVCADGIP